MTLTVACRALDADKHEKDVSTLLYHKGKLFSGGDDGKIKVKVTLLLQKSIIKIYNVSS